MANVPTEIWQEIACHIPDGTIYPRLLSVNSDFFHLAMDLKWRDVDIKTIEFVDSMKKIKRLRDSAVARKVHRMELHLFYPDEPSIGQAGPSHGGSYRITEKNKEFRRILHPEDLDVSRSSDATQSPSYSYDELTDALLVCMPHFSSITSFTVRVVTTDDPRPISLRPLFEAGWTSFGHNLQSLFLGAKLGDFSQFPLSASTFRCLKGLRLEFYYSSVRLEHGDALLTDIIVPFINSLDSQLKTLTLHFWFPVDYSNFFSQLSEFPTLKSLTVYLTLHILKNLSGLKTFLCDSSRQVQSLDLNFRIFDGKDHINACQFLIDCAQDPTWLSDIHTLSIQPPEKQFGVDTLLAFAHGVTKTLTTLTISNYHWDDTRDSVQKVIDAFSQCLKLTSLDVEMATIGISVFDYLALKLPNLERLTILHALAYHGDEYDELLQDLKGHSYDQWKLKDVAIYRATRSTPDIAIVFALGRSIPSVETLFGKKIFRSSVNNVC